MQDGAATARRVLLLMAALLCLAVALMCLTSCRMSDVLKEILYDQSAEMVEYDNPDKFYINDSTAEQESSLVPASETSDDAPASDVRQNLVVYSSDPNSDEYVAKKSVFDKYPDFTGIEASEGATLQYSDSPDAIDHEVPNDTVVDVEATETQEATEAPTAPRSEARQAQRGGEGGSDGEGGSEGAGDAGEEEPDPGVGGGDEGPEAPQEVDDGGGGGGEVEVIDSTGAFSEPPKVDAIAAFGEAAVIVQMVGGQGALVATDGETLDSDFKTVFADEGAAAIKRGWTDGGSAGAIDADAIIESGAKSILVYAGNYKDGIPEEALAKLKKAGVSFTVIPTLTNSTYIKQAVTTVGSILSDSQDIANKGLTAQVAADYCQFHDDLVNACLAANGGSLASSGAVVYESKNRSPYLFDEGANYTLVLDGFDKSARFTRTIGGWKPVCNGAAMTTIGYSNSPLSFYIQAGGLINNAAACSSSGESERIVAWQFNTNILSPEKSNWEYDPSGLMANSVDIDSGMAQGWRRTVFNTGVNAAANGVASSFGSPKFPKAIVTSADIRDKLVENSANVNGLYHPYDLVAASEGGLQISAIGPLVNGTTIVYSSIGVGAEGVPTSWSGSSIPADAFEVNPEGLVGSWTDGSVESVLEAPWVNDVVAGNGNAVGYRDYVKRFYERFYRYQLSDTELARIVNGG